MKNRYFLVCFEAFTEWKNLTLRFPSRGAVGAAEKKATFMVVFGSVEVKAFEKRKHYFCRELRSSQVLCSFHAIE